MKDRQDHSELKEKDDVSNLTSSKLLAFNTAISLSSNALLLFIPLFTIPPLIHLMGLERFGLLTLAWTILGYFSLFDMGLGRALTYVISKKMGENKFSEINAVAWIGLLLMFGSGMLGGGLIASIDEWIVFKVLNVSPEFQQETLQALQILSISIPFVILSVGLRGMLEAKQRVLSITLVDGPMRIYTFLGPLGMAYFHTDLPSILAVLMVGRVVGCLLYFLFVLHNYSGFITNFSFELKHVPSLFRVGRWIVL